MLLLFFDSHTDEVLDPFVLLIAIYKVPQDLPAEIGVFIVKEHVIVAKIGQAAQIIDNFLNMLYLQPSCHTRFDSG